MPIWGPDRTPIDKLKSVSSRASKVLPTRGRGDATMVTELRNDIDSPDADRPSAQFGRRLAGGRSGALFRFWRDQVDQLDPVEFAPNLAQPMTHIAT